MKRVLTRLHRDERGMSFVFVGMGFMAFLAATTLAIDVGMFMTARSQAQTSADSAAPGRRDRARVRRLRRTGRARDRQCRTRSRRPAELTSSGERERQSLRT